MASGLVVFYLAAALGVPSGLATAMIFASPSLAGILRCFAPVLLDRFPHKKQFCVTANFTQIAFLIAMVGITRPGVLSNPTAITLLVTFWCAANLCEHLSWISLLAWYGEIFPERTRGRFFGKLERRRLIGEVAGLLLSIGLATLARHFLPATFPKYAIYSAILLLGTLFLAGSPYFLLRAATVSRSVAVFPSWAERVRQLRAPFLSRRYRPLLAYGAFFSFFVQLEQVSQQQFPKTLLVAGFAFLVTTSFRLITKLGQAAVGPFCGRWLDRHGTVRVLLLSQLLTAAAPLFYLVASPSCWWLMYGAPVFWIAYVGLNVGLPQVQLQLADSQDTPPWIAAYGLTCGVFAFAGVLTGGILFDRFHTLPLFYPAIFAFSCLTRLTAAGLLLWVVLPSHAGQAGQSGVK